MILLLRTGPWIPKQLVDPITLPSSIFNYKKLNIMAQSLSMQSEKKLITVDITSETVCPWCFIGKRHLNKAMDASKDLYNFRVRWHPFLLNPSAPKEGIEKTVYWKQKFGDENVEPIISRVSKACQVVGIDFKSGGLTGNTLDSHRLIAFASQQGLEKQNALVEELFLNYFTQQKYIGDRKVLLEAAEKVGITGAKEWLDDPNNGLKEINEELQTYARSVTGVPHFLINGQYKLHGAQQSETFLKAFQVAATDDKAN
jgi:predicted DsbA family dithiol-disulfide isomerase